MASVSFGNRIRIRDGLSNVMADWRYEDGKRDLRLDFIRGFAILAMVANHIGGHDSWLYYITGGNRFFISAAEVFVLLAGLVMGIIYAGVMRRDGVAEGLKKALQRAWTLYKNHVLLSIGFALSSTLLGVSWGPNFTPSQWVDFAWGIATLQRTYYLTDILLLYTFLMMAAGPLLALLARGYTPLALAASWGLWAVWQIDPTQIELPWAVEGNGLFKFNTWQVIFVTGLVIGFHRRGIERRLPRLPMGRWLLVLGLLVVGLAHLFAVDYDPYTSRALNEFWSWQLYIKSYVPFGRLAVLAIFVLFGYALATVAWRPLQRALGWLLIPLGQNSLNAYVFHLWLILLVATALPMVLPDDVRTAPVNAVIQLIGILALWVMVKVHPIVRERMTPLFQPVGSLTSRLVSLAMYPVDLVRKSTATTSVQESSTD